MSLENSKKNLDLSLNCLSIISLFEHYNFLIPIWILYNFKLTLLDSKQSAQKVFWDISVAKPKPYKQI